MAARAASGSRRPKVEPFLWLAVSAEWVEAHCVIPDRNIGGPADPFVLADEQLTFWAHHYRLKPKARPTSKPAEAFWFRRSQLVRGQKWGKSPLMSAFICVEAVGPAVFAGWAAGGELYRCIDWGCDCGWVYAYEPGEAMGKPWRTIVAPLIQVTAANEDQTANTYGALRPMIDRGPLAALIPKTGEEFIRLPGAGQIETVTGSMRGRLGQRLTFAPQDETGTYITRALRNMADTQLRGAAGLGGRGLETTNPWDPSEDSTAQRTYESTVTDIHRDFLQPPPGLKFSVKAERRKIFTFLYKGAPWVSTTTIEGLAAELINKGESGQAERFYGQRVTAGSALFLEDETLWPSRARKRRVRFDEPIVLGFDGSLIDDWTALRAETLDGFQFTPTYGPAGRPTRWNPAEYPGHMVPREEVDAAVDEMWERWNVLMQYNDPAYWETETDRWASKHGEQRVRRFYTNRVVQMHPALERFVTDLTAGTLDHDGDPVTAQHVRNARRAARPQMRYIIEKASDAQKIDDCMASVIVHEAAGDAIAGGLTTDTDPTTNYAWGFG